MGRVERLFTFSVRHPLVTLAMVLGLTLVTSLGLPRLHIDTSYDSLIDPDDPETAYYNKVIHEFRSDYVVLIYLQARDLFTPAKLSRLEALTHALEKLERAEDVRGLFTVGNIQNEDGVLDVRPVLEATPATPAETAQAYRRARRNPFVLDNLLSRDGTATVVTVTFRDSWNDDPFAERTYRRIEDLLAPLRGEFASAFQLGPPRAIIAGRQAVLHDMAFIGLFSVVLLVGSLLLFLRARSAMLLPLLTAGVSLYWTFGLLGLMGIPLAMMAAVLPAMMVVVGSAEDTHMVAAYLDALREGAADRTTAVHHMVRRIGFASILTAATTVVGFAANGVTWIAMMRNSAIALSLGIAMNFVVTVLIIPVMLARFGPRRARPLRAKWSPPRLVNRFTEAAIGFSNRHGGVLTWGAVALTLACIVIGAFLKPNTDPIGLLNPRHPLVRDLRTLHSHMAGAQLLYVVVEGKAPGTFKQPRMLARLASIEQRIRASDGFDTALSLADHLSFVNREMNGGRPEMYRVPEDPNLIEQYLLLFSRADLRNVVTNDYRRANILVRYKTFNSSELDRDLALVEPTLRAAAGPDLRVHFTSKSILLTRSAESMVQGNLVTVIVLILVVATMIGLAYRSWRFGLIVLVPNVLPSVAIFGVMAGFGIPLDPGTVLAADVALGIAVDDTIHFMNAFRNGLRETSDTEAAASHAVRDQALPVTAVTVGLTACFASLMLSEFKATANFGLLCAAAIAFSQPCDLVITPALLRRFGTGRVEAARRRK